MFGTELNVQPTPVVKRLRKRPRADLKPHEYEELFVLLTTLRAAPAEALDVLFFRSRGFPKRTARRRLAALVAEGWLVRVRLDGARVVYHLTQKSIALTESIQRRARDFLWRTPSDGIAQYCWMRSTMWADLKAHGVNVGRGASELRALRRSLLDPLIAQIPTAASAQQRDGWNRALAELRASELLTVHARPRCRRCRWSGAADERVEKCPQCSSSTESIAVETMHRCTVCPAVAFDRPSDGHVNPRTGQACTGSMVEGGVLPFDVAWVKTDTGYVAHVLWVDDPSRSVDSQLRDLPSITFAQPRFSVILRSTDAQSRYDRKTKTWANVGPRRAELLHAFGENGRLAHSAKLTDVRPEIQTYYVR